MQKSNLSQEQIKQLNKVRILNLIKEHQEITKNDISNYLNLSIPTITTNIRELINEGLIEEAGVAKSTGGRKPIIIKFLNNSKYSIGVNITPKNIDIQVVNLNSEPIDYCSIKYDITLDFELILEQISDAIYELLNKNTIDINNVVGIGIALPGVVDDIELILWDAPNINVHSFSFKAFEEKLGLSVYIENEANVSAFAEIQMGYYKDVNSLIYLSITEGIGAGIIIDNQIFKGTRKRAGEFGHHKISNENRPCNCGRTDCWELYASINALIRYYYEESGDYVESASVVFKEFNNNNNKAINSIDKYIDSLITGIENIILGLNPDYIIIGGELSEYYSEINSILETKLKRINGLFEIDGVKIVFSQLKRKSALIGATLLPLENIFNYKLNIY